MVLDWWVSGLKFEREWWDLLYIYLSAGCRNIGAKESVGNAPRGTQASLLLVCKIGH